jgi:serine/threonine protein kinase
MRLPQKPNKMSWDPEELPAPFVRTSGAGGGEEEEKVWKCGFQQYKYTNDEGWRMRFGLRPHEKENGVVNKKKKQRRQSYFGREIGEVLGEGQYGKVYALGSLKGDKEQSVAKVIECPTNWGEEYWVAACELEIQILELFKENDTPNVLHLLEYTRLGKEYVIRLPRFSKTMWSWVQKVQEDYNKVRRAGTCKMPVQLLKESLKQMLNGLRAIHELGVIHLDIKPDNMLVHTEPSLHIVISDFGLSKFTDDKDRLKVNDHYGTTEYMAPELWFLTEPFDYKVDMWSLGITMANMVTDKYLFDDGEKRRKRQITMQFQQVDSKDVESEAYQRYLEVKTRLESDRLDGKKLFHIFEGLLQTDPTERYSAAKALEVLTNKFEE